MVIFWKINNNSICLKFIMVPVFFGNTYLLLNKIYFSGVEFYYYFYFSISLTLQELFHYILLRKYSFTKEMLFSFLLCFR